MLFDNDADGDLDILVAANSGEITWFRNFGDGTFSVAARLAQTPARTGQMELVDVVGGARPELVTLQDDGAVRVYRAIGGSTWALLEQIDAPSIDVLDLADLGDDGDIELLLGSSESRDVFVVENELRGEIGAPYCGPATPNSTGGVGRLQAVGSDIASLDALELRASRLPLQSLSFFLMSQTQGDVFPATNSLGRLCLGGSLGRYVGPGQIRQTGATGRITLALDLTAIPQPNGPVAAVEGDVWNFQAWHRDTSGGAATSNFTEAVSVTLR